MRQTWNKAVRSLGTGILGLSRFTFGKPAFVIVLLAVIANLVMIPRKIKLARVLKRFEDLQKGVSLEVMAIEEKYQPDPGKPASFEEIQQKEEELKQLYQNNSLRFPPKFSFDVVGFLPTLGAITASIVVNGIKEDERFTEGGILWFKDLTKPDHYRILPMGQAGILVARRFINPLQFNKGQTLPIPGLKRFEQVTNVYEYLPMFFFLGPLVRNKRSAAESLYTVAQAGVELMEDYVIRKLVK